MNTKVSIRRADRKNPLPAVRELLESLSWKEVIPKGASVALKPNLCTERPDRIYMANTSLGVVRAVCEVLLERTSRITIVESDGARYVAEDAFRNTGIERLSADLGITTCNLSKDEVVEIPDSRLKGFGLPRCWMGADVFITLPVLKTHATTVFTGAMKNQWGCIPRRDRILLHKFLHELVGTINKIRPVTLAVMDGLVGMQGRGPINGFPINLDVVLASRDPVALDATAMRLIGLKPSSAKHLVHAQELGVGTLSEEHINVDGPFAGCRTTVVPAQEDWAIKLLNWIARSPVLTRHLLLNDRVFYPVRRMVMIARRLMSGSHPAPAVDA